MSKRLSLFLIIFSFSLGAQEFVTKRNTCRIGIYKEEQKKYPDLSKKLEQLLKDRGYELFEMKRKVFPGELYAHLEQEMLGEGWFPDCYVKLTIQESEEDEPKKADPYFFKRSTKRKFPRIFWSGSYRCELALKDLFIHVPYCRTP